MKTKLYLLIFIFITITNLHAQSPQWSWAKSFGSDGDEMAPCSTLDLEGNLYVMGHHTALSLTFDDTTIYNSSPNNAYLLKYNSSGALIYARSLDIDVNPAKIMIDKDNKLIAIAYFMETLIIDNITVHKTSEGGNNGSDLVLFKFDTTGTIQWASNGFGSDSFDRVSGIALDDSSNIYVGGAFDGTSLIFNNDTIYNSGGNDVFLLKFNSTGTQIWARGVNGSLDELGGGICIDKNGFIYNTGTYTSQTINFDGSSSLSNHGNNLHNKSIFFAKYSPSGTLNWYKRIGGYGNEDNPFIKTDSDNNIYIAGTSESQPIFYESTDIPNDQWNTFTVKLNNEGTLLWSKTSIGTGYKVIKDFAIDTAGNTFSYGYFCEQYSLGADSFSGSLDIFLSKISASGNALWSKNIFGNLFEIPDNITLHPDGSIYISGSFQSNTLYLDAQHLINNSTVSGYSDIFIAHTTNYSISSNGPLCIGNNLQLSFSTIPSATYSWSGPNNFSSTEQNPVIENCIESISGPYSVHVVAPGLTDIYDTINVNIYPIPTTPDAVDSVLVCLGDSVTLSSSVIPNATYYWTSATGFSTIGQNLLITPDSSVCLYLHAEVNGCSSLFDSTFIKVNPVPAAPSIFGNSPVCISAPISLYADSLIGATYEWNGPDGFTTHDQNPSVCSSADLSKSGYYYANISINDCKSPADSIYIFVNPPMSRPAICIIGNDSIYHKNMIVWNKETSNAINYYKIYKESSILNQYELIGTVPYDSLSVFVDTLSNPLQNSFRYRISTIDTCGTETELSTEHKTIHLSICQGLNNTFNLFWNNYEGVPVLSYNIYRGTSNDSLVLLTSLPSSVNSYTDFSPNDGYIYYQIEITGDFNCSPTKSNYYNSSRSNIASNNPDFIAENELLSLFPVPADNFIRISAPTTTNGQQAQIFNINGILILSESFGMNENVIDVSTLDSGIYLIKIIQDGNVITSRFIKR